MWCLLKAIRVGVEDVKGCGLMGTGANGLQTRGAGEGRNGKMEKKERRYECCDIRLNPSMYSDFICARISGFEASSGGKE